MRDEFSFITSITPNHYFQKQLSIGIGDDAAVYKTSNETEQVVCVDAMVEGIHFRKDTLSSFQIGRKALAINISDLAAMGATPAYYLVTLAIPRTWTEEELQEIYRGMNQIAINYQMDLIGGDTVSSDSQLMLSVTAIGTVKKGQALKRSTAKPNDVVFVTGPLGRSAAGLHLLQQKNNKPFTNEELACIQVHQEPEPQVDSGMLFSQVNKRIALNDISDGLSSEAMELAEASKQQIVIEHSKLTPVLPSIETASLERKLDWLFNGGEDFQLIGATSRETFQQLQKSAQNDLFEIGYVRSGSPSVFMRNGETESLISKSGYNHFN
ncbi:thiamine-phosphate kinase [Alkalihalobacillus sp. LMS6]|uniref:thiamine-phosphate kinase n=1 Tax=Bacillaceae TaxID=186817 RepID=UPI000C07C73A|nr:MULTISPECIES: thiamine-phosphate kinase [Bacillaceae]UTR05708.1 thiamine-phosphate kinase [Alkalihalobacillus sp. LMS6]